MPRYKELLEVLAGVRNVKEMDKLLHEILTPKELEDIGRRWQIMKEIYQGISQREISERHKMSLCKVTRGSKVIKGKNSICKRILEKKAKK